MGAKKKGTIKKNSGMSKSDYLLQNKDKIVRRRKRRRAFLRMIFLLILIGAIGMYIALEQEVFNIKTVAVSGSRIVKNEEIILLSKVKVGDNIFAVKNSEVKEGVLANSYIKDVRVKRVLPDKLEIEVYEREGEYYQKFGETFFVIDGEGFVLEGRNNLHDLNLFQVEGIQMDDIIVGEFINDEDIRKKAFLEKFTQLRKVNSSGVKFSKIDVSDMNDVKMYLGNFEIKLGTDDNLKDKMNAALNIYIEKKLVQESGYIDVGFKGNPVLYINKQVEDAKNADEGEETISDDASSTQ